MRLSLQVGFSEQRFSHISDITLRKTCISLMVTEIGMSLVLALAGSQGPWHQYLPFRQPIFPICIPPGQSSPSLKCPERAGTLAGNAELSDLAQLGTCWATTPRAFRKGDGNPLSRGRKSWASQVWVSRELPSLQAYLLQPDGGTEQQEVRAAL